MLAVKDACTSPIHRIIDDDTDRALRELQHKVFMLKKNVEQSK